MRFVFNLLVLLLGLAPIAASAQPAAKLNLAITPFAFLDTSGEVRDQTEDHRHRLDALVSALTKQLEDSGRFEFGTLACGDASCSGDEALKTARDRGYGYVLFGAVQKTSSLVMWAHVEVVDAKTAKLLFKRWITFRGDTDESWSRTGRYIGRDMVRPAAK